MGMDALLKEYVTQMDAFLGKNWYKKYIALKECERILWQ